MGYSYNNFTKQRKEDGVALILDMSKLMFVAGVLVLLTMPSGIGLLFFASSVFIRLLGFIIKQVPTSTRLPQQQFTLLKKRTSNFDLIRVVNSFCFNSKYLINRVNMGICNTRMAHNRAKRSIARPAFAGGGGGDSDDDGGDSSSSSSDSPVKLKKHTYLLTKSIKNKQPNSNILILITVTIPRLMLHRRHTDGRGRWAA